MKSIGTKSIGMEKRPAAGYSCAMKAARSSAKSSAPAAAPPKDPAAPARAPRLLPAAQVEEAFRRLAELNPEPKGELEHSDAFTLLVAVVLSAQATDAGVNKATRGLFAAASTPQAMADLGEEAIADYVKTIGLYRGKAKNVAELSRRLVAEHGGEVPAERAALEALPGVGRKTANVVLNIAFGQETIAVDTHVFRVSNRLRLAPGANVGAVEAGLEKRVPARYRLHAHHWLILHGRYVCKAQHPACFNCALADLCPFPDKTPAPLARPRPVARPETTRAARTTKAPR
jgi:endonuclease-3